MTLAFTCRAPALVVVLALAVAMFGCGTTLVEVRPSEPIATASGGGPLQAAVEGIWITDDLAEVGMADDQAVAFQLRLINRGSTPRQVSPAAFACLMVLDSALPGETLSLVASGGAEGPFPGDIPDEGSLLGSVTIGPGEARSLWALFRGYRYPASDVPRRILLEIPDGEGPPLELTLGDPARGALRWQLPPKRAAISIGLRNTALFGGLTAQSASTEITRVARAGALLWEVGLVSSLFVQSKGPLLSDTSSCVGSGITARLTMPMLGWGAALDPRQLSLYAGGTAQLLLEIVGDRPAGDMTPPRSYGLFTIEAGLELDVGALRFAGTPFPLTPAGHLPLPRWTIRLGYTHAWIGGVQADGYVTSIRFLW
jgi:hypothetical protein